MVTFFLVNWEEFEIAHLATGGIGIELFSFPHGVKEAPQDSILSIRVFSIFAYKIKH
jgi:hypothetical protein